MTSTPYFAETARDDGPARSLRAHIPAQAVLTELFQHVQVNSRSRLDRLLGKSPLSAEAASWFVGALGEQCVGEALGALPAPWVVLHAVPVGKGNSDIDHVVLGPAGVFTINTKHHPDKSVWVAGRTILVSGRKQPYIPKAEGEAKAATKLLRTAAGTEVPVRPVIALVGLKQLTVREKPQYVHVTRERHLIRWLLAQPAVLAASELAKLLSMAASPTTWHHAPPQLEPAAVLQQKFRLLDREVRQARRTRLAWVGSAAACAVAALTVGAPELLQEATDFGTSAP